MSVQLLLVAFSAAFGHLPLLRAGERPCSCHGGVKAGFLPRGRHNISLSLPRGCLVSAWASALGPCPQAEISSPWVLAIKSLPSRRVSLQQVAKKMNLDMRKTSSLWKDQALVEINIAVLYSFQVPRDAALSWPGWRDAGSGWDRRGDTHPRTTAETGLGLPDVGCCGEM